MKLENKQFFYIGTDTFQCDIGCFINYTPKEAVKYLKNKKRYQDLSQLIEKACDVDNAEFDNDYIRGRMLPLDRGYCMFLKFYADSHRKNMSLVVHEMTHVVSWLLLDRRIELSKDTDEVYAYLMESLMEQFFNKWY